MNARDYTHYRKRKKLVEQSSQITETNSQMNSEKTKAKYFKEQFEKNATNVKKNWEVINSVIQSKK